MASEPSGPFRDTERGVRHDRVHVQGGVQGMVYPGMVYPAMYTRCTTAYPPYGDMDHHMASGQLYTKTMLI